jgi:hypothetical protein
VFAFVVRLNAPPNFSNDVARYRRLSKGEMSREPWSRSFWGTMPMFRKAQNCNHDAAASEALACSLLAFFRRADFSKRVVEQKVAADLQSAGDEKGLYRKSIRTLRSDHWRGQ